MRYDTDSSLVLRPILGVGVYVFATLPHGTSIPPELDPVLILREDEGNSQ
jgi:hypothetical protein